VRSYPRRGGAVPLGTALPARAEAERRPRRALGAGDARPRRTQSLRPLHLRASHRGRDVPSVARATALDAQVGLGRHLLPERPAGRAAGGDRGDRHPRRRTGRRLHVLRPRPGRPQPRRVRDSPADRGVPAPRPALPRPRLLDRRVAQDALQESSTSPLSC
jgi:hypothetical protein